MSNQQELISVVIPTYNRAGTITRCLNSVLKQTYNNIEVIVVDDCSSDNTKEIVNSFSDSRLKYICLDKNSGACVARNVGVSNAKGKIIAFQDSDDTWSKNKLELQCKELFKHNADILFCGMERMDEENNRMMDTFPSCISKGFVEYDAFLPGNLMSTQTMIGYRECFENNPFDSEMPRFQDWELALRLAQKYKIYYDGQILVQAYLQKDSITKSHPKTVVGLLRILDDNLNAYYNHPKIYYDLCGWLAKEQVLCEQDPTNTYKRMLRTKFTFKIAIKRFLCGIGIRR